MTALAPALPGNPHLVPTRILDYEHGAVQSVIARLGRSGPSPRAFVQAAHAYLGTAMKAVYSIDDDRPVSVTVQLNEGSCAQRMAALEALARGYGTPTRVRALWLHRRFWVWRLTLLYPFLPARTFMPWPQFLLDGQWVDFDEIYGSMATLARDTRVDHAFTNRGESLFDAVRSTPVDLFGKLRGGPYARYDISRSVAQDDGCFETRDDAVAARDKKPGSFGRWLFDTIYGGRPIHRMAE